MDVPISILEKVTREPETKKKKELAIQAGYLLIDYLKKKRNHKNYKDIKILIGLVVEFCESKNCVLNKKIIEGLKEFNDNSNKQSNAEIKRNFTDEFKSKSNNDKGTSFEDVVGLKMAKKALEESVKLPFKHPELFIGNRRSPKGILLYGPPGTGKTYLVNSLQSINDNLKLITVSASDLFSKYQGESEKLIKNLFESAEASKPCIIFIDEIDFLCRDRSESTNECSTRIKSELLIRMNDLTKGEGVILIGATNFPWTLDHAFIRRFQKKIYIGLPSEEDRIDLFKMYLNKNKNRFVEEDFIEMKKLTNNYSNSDIKNLCERMLCIAIDDLREAEFFILENGLWRVSNEDEKGSVRYKFDELEGKIMEPEVKLYHFYESIKGCKSSIKVEELETYNQWTIKYGEK